MDDGYLKDYVIRLKKISNHKDNIGL